MQLSNAARDDPHSPSSRLSWDSRTSWETAPPRRTAGRQKRLERGENSSLPHASHLPSSSSYAIEVSSMPLIQSPLAGLQANLLSLVQVLVRNRKPSIALLSPSICPSNIAAAPIPVSAPVSSRFAYYYPSPAPLFHSASRLLLSLHPPVCGDRSSPCDVVQQPDMPIRLHAPAFAARSLHFTCAALGTSSRLQLAPPDLRALLMRLWNWAPTDDRWQCISELLLSGIVFRS